MFPTMSVEDTDMETSFERPVVATVAPTQKRFIDPQSVVGIALTAVVVLALAPVASVAGDGGSSSSGHAVAVVKTTPESALANIVLTPQAEARIGITTAPVERRSMPRWRNYPAELMLPPGQTARLVAAIAGTVRATKDAWPVPGMRVKRGQVVAGLQAVLLEPDRLRVAELQLNIATARAQADAEVRRAAGALDLARKNLARSKKLVAAEAGSVRALQEMEAALTAAEAAHAAATDRLTVFDQLKLKPTTEVPITWLEAPIDGIVRDVQALPGQPVAPGAPILELIDLDRLWARVSVPIDELGAVRRGSARLALDSDSKPDAWVDVTSVPAPPTAAAASASVDLYFAIDNKSSALSPGMRAVAALPIVGESDSLVVPWSSVVHDPGGSSWVYAWTAPHTFARRRVVVDRVIGGVAVLSSGPSKGAPIATAGISELFGLDVGYAK